MVGQMMWFKREPKPVAEKPAENGVVNRLRRKKVVLLKPARESSERETESTESEKEKRRYSDILDIKVSQDRRDESDESLYESADCQSDAISASDDALPMLGKTPTMSKESLKLAITDEEVDLRQPKKGHRKTMSLSNTLEILKNVGDEWFDHSHKKELEKISDVKKSRESLWSEEERDSIHGSNFKLNERKNSKKEDKSQSNSRKSCGSDLPKPRKSSKSSALNFLRRKKTQIVSAKPTEPVAEVVDKVISTEELLNYTRLFLEEEKRYASLDEVIKQVAEETDSETDYPSPKILDEHRRRLSRQTSRSKSKVRGKSQTVKVNTIRKSHSGTLKKNKKKGMKTPIAARSRQASIVETPVFKKKFSHSAKQNSWFSSTKGEPRREGSTEDSPAADAEPDVSDNGSKDVPEKDSNWRTAVSNSSGRGVNRAESCRERDAPRRGKHRNASDPNRLTAHNHHDLEPGAATAPSGSSSSSSLSSRSNESNTVAADQQASQSDWSEEDEPLAAQWADSLPPQVLDTLLLSARLRKRQEVIHELIVSEGSHNRWLKVLGSVFLRPLEGQPSLLPPEELKALFPNLPHVREHHSKLYADLRAARSKATDHVVRIRPVADALLNTLGDSNYASCLSRFCRSQRLALDALKERRRKNKELQQFLSSREQMPLCARLQLRDLLACVWQRLTKYQLLLESILKTVSDTEGEAESESEEDVATLKRALDTAKDVLQCVDAAIRKAENEHRLRTIQNKLEVRVPTAGSEWEELRRLELTNRTLRHEGELSVRNDSNKKIQVLALMLEDCLVLLHREGDKFLLKPIAQPSAQGVLSPLVKWEKVLFRPNAAVKNTFFLMNINSPQMHELSAATHSEYATWVKHIQELPLAKPELKPSLTPSHQASRSTDDSGINVSRNPSDASEKSNSTAPEDECERDRALSVNDREKDSNRCDDGREEAKEREEKHKPRRPTVGRISTHSSESTPPLVEAKQALTVSPPVAETIAYTAERALSHHERLRRLDESISQALRAKCAVVSELLGMPPGSFAQMADLAVAETLGQVDVCSELRATRLSRSSSTEEDVPSVPPTAPPTDMYQLLLAAQAQANQLTETLSKALTVNEAAAAAARVRGRCDRCRNRTNRQQENESHARLETTIEEATTKLTETIESNSDLLELEPEKLDGATCEGDPAEALESNLTAAALASRLVSSSCGLQATLARVLCALPGLEDERQTLRRRLAVTREAEDVATARCLAGSMPEEISYAKDDVDQTIQDQPSNGG